MIKKFVVKNFWLTSVLFAFLSNTALLEAQHQKITITRKMGFVMHRTYAIHVPHFFGVHPNKILIETSVGPVSRIHYYRRTDGQMIPKEKLEASATFKIRDYYGRLVHVGLGVCQTEHGLEEKKKPKAEFPRVLKPVIRRLLRELVTEYYQVNPKYKRILNGLAIKVDNKLKYIKAKK